MNGIPTQHSPERAVRRSRRARGQRPVSSHERALDHLLKAGCGLVGNSPPGGINQRGTRLAGRRDVSSGRMHTRPPAGAEAGSSSDSMPDIHHRRARTAKSDDTVEAAGQASTEAIGLDAPPPATRSQSSSAGPDEKRAAVPSGTAVPDADAACEPPGPRQGRPDLAADRDDGATESANGGASPGASNEPVTFNSPVRRAIEESVATTVKKALEAKQLEHREEINNLCRRIDATEAENEELRGRCNATEVRQESLERSTDARITALDLKASDAERKADEAQRGTDEIRADLTEVRGIAVNADAKAEGADAKAEGADAKAEAAGAKYEDLKEDAEILAEVLETHEIDMREVKSDLRQQDERVAGLESTAEEQGSQLVEQRSQLKEYKDRLERAEAEIASINSKFDKLGIEQENVRDLCEQLGLDYEQLDGAMSEIAARFDNVLTAADAVALVQEIIAKQKKVNLFKATSFVKKFADKKQGRKVSTAEVERLIKGRGDTNEKDDEKSEMIAKAYIVGYDTDTGEFGTIPLLKPSPKEIGLKILPALGYEEHGETWMRKEIKRLYERDLVPKTRWLDDAKGVIFMRYKSGIRPHHLRR